MIVDRTNLTGNLVLAVDSLIGAQNADGSWYDFWLPGGASDEWVTAYTGASLALVRSDRARRAALRAWEFLANQPPGRCGWGYSRATPPDADSTAWACILADRISQRETVASKRGAEFLATASGAGAATYSRDAAIRVYTGADERVSFAGWTQPHWCVSGAVALASESCNALLEAIVCAQRTDGSWRSYWWCDDLYATAFCAAALARHRRGSDARNRAAEYARSAGCEAEDAFALALASITCAAANDTAAATRFAHRLAEVQKPDGSWERGAWLRVPAPDVVDPASIASFEPWMGVLVPGRTVAMCNFSSLDFTSTFTAATAVAALTLATGSQRK